MHSPVQLRLPSRRAAWLALAAVIAAWIFLDTVVQVGRDQLLAHFQISGTRAIVATRALFNIGLMWAALAATMLILRARRQTLTDIGWKPSASKLAWLLALGLAVLYLAVTLGTVGGRAQLLSDWSFYRVSLGLVLGVSAGICTETIFRGFVITQARDAGLPVAIQILLSSVLFGLALARFGWSGATASPDVSVVVAVVAATAILGSMFAAIYLVGRRSLMPAIAAHTAIDMVVQPGMLIFLFNP